jgi:hypothetical protein
MTDQYTEHLILGAMPIDFDTAFTTTSTLSEFVQYSGQ